MFFYELSQTFVVNKNMYNFSFIIFFVFCIIKFLEVLWMNFVWTMQNKSHFEVCAILEICKMFLSFNILNYLQSMLFCKLSMRTITSGECCKNLPSQWARYALMLFTWTRSNPTIRDNTFSHYYYYCYYLHLQVYNHVMNDFGVDCAIGQFVWSYIITRCKMLVKL
jgi:hypothetical protein